jgi:hypothetical protein
MASATQLRTARTRVAKLALTGSEADIMSEDGRKHMLLRHEVVVRIIETNSRRLRLDNEINGLDIERRIAERDIAAAGTSQCAITALEAINENARRLDQERTKLDAERSWLEEQLAAFDDPIRAHHTKPGTA